MDTETFEELSAYKDGELSPEAAEKFEQKLQQNEELRDALLTMTQLDNSAKTVFDEMLSDTISLHQVSRITKAFDNQKRQKSGWNQNWWAPAIAASILALLVSGGVGYFAFEQYNTKLLAQIQAAQEADSQRLAKLLQEALETQVSGTAVKFSDPKSSVSMQVEPVHTYKSESGHWCREFNERIERDGVVEFRKGLACREQKGQWRRLKTTIEGESGGKL